MRIPALAQPVISAKSGVVSYVIGKVMVGDQEVKPSETKITEIKENAVLRTEEGRAEVLLTLGAILRIGDNSSFKMLTNRLIDTRVELLTGTHILEVAEIQKDNNLTLVVKDATVVITKRGLYRFDVDQSRIKVFEGVLGRHREWSEHPGWVGQGDEHHDRECREVRQRSHRCDGPLGASAVRN